MSSSHRVSLWKQNLIVVAVAELVAVLGFSVIIAFLPLYVQELGIQAEREIRIWSGVVLAAHAVTMTVFGPIWGALGDRFGRKVMVERALFSGAVLVALMGAARNVQQVVILRALQGMLTGSVTAATVLVASAAPRQRTGYALGILQMSIYVGASAGPLLGGVISDSFGYRATFWVMGGLLLLAALGVSLFVREDFEPVVLEPDPQAGGRRPWRRLAPVLGSSVLLTVLGIRLLMRLGLRLLGPVMPLFVQDMVAADAPVASITGLISGVSAAAGAIGAFGVGRLSDRVSSRRVLVGCSIASVLCYVPQYWVTDPLPLVFLQMGTGLAMGGVLAAVSASLARLSPEGQQGIVYGLDASVMSVANAVGPILGSTLAAWLGLRLPFLVAASFCGIAGLFALWRLPDGRDAEDCVGLLG